MKSLLNWAQMLLLGVGITVGAATIANAEEDDSNLEEIVEENPRSNYYIVDPTDPQLIKIAAMKASTKKNILAKYTEYEIKTKQFLTRAERLSEVLPTYRIPHIVPLEDEKEEFTRNTAREDLDDLRQLEASIELQIKGIQEKEFGLEIRYKSEMQTIAAEKKENSPVFAERRFVENKVALEKYQTLHERLDSLENLVLQREENRTIHAQDNTINYRRQQLIKLFVEYYGTEDPSFIGSKQETLHFIPAKRAEKFTQELQMFSGVYADELTVQNYDNIQHISDKITSSEGEHLKKEKNAWILKENEFIRLITENGEILQVTEEIRQEYSKQINDLLGSPQREPEIKPITIYDADGNKTLAYTFAHVSRKKEERVLAERNLFLKNPLTIQEDAIAEKTEAEKTGREKGVQTEVEKLTVETQPKNLPTISTYNRTQVRSKLLEMYGDKFPEENLHANLWNIVPVITGDEEDVYVKRNQKFRHDWLNHDPNIQVIREVLAEKGLADEDYTYPEKGENLERNKAIDKLIYEDNRIVLHDKDYNECLEELEKLAKKESLSPEEKTYGTLLIRTARHLEEQVLTEYNDPVSDQIDQEILTYSTLERENNPTISPDPIERRNEILSVYNTSGAIATSTEELNTAIQVARATENYRGRFRMDSFNNDEQKRIYEILLGEGSARSKVDQVREEMNSGLSYSWGLELSKKAPEILRQYSIEKAQESTQLASLVEENAHRNLGNTYDMFRQPAVLPSRKRNYSLKEIAA